MIVGDWLLCRRGTRSLLRDLPQRSLRSAAKHHHLLGSNVAVCDALTEVKGHVNKYGKHLQDPIISSSLTSPIEKYLKERSTSAKFDREDYDCLSNKFLSKLVIRAN